MKKTEWKVVRLDTAILDLLDPTLSVNNSLRQLLGLPLKVSRGRVGFGSREWRRKKGKKACKDGRKKV